MNPGALACVDTDCQLLVRSVQHPVPWLKGQREAKCVVEVVRLGLVRIWPLMGWAARHGHSPEEAEEVVREQEDEPYERGAQGGGVFMAAAKRKKSRRAKQGGRPLHEIKLPASAILALFQQGTGPMTVRRGGGTDSGKVVLTVGEEFVELEGQPHL